LLRKGYSSTSLAAKFLPLLNICGFHFAGGHNRHLIVQTSVNSTPIPKKHPDILPREADNGVLASSMPCFLRYCAALPSHKPANPSVMASPAAAPTIAPKIPAKLAPIRAAIPRKKVSTEPKTMPAEHDFIVRPTNFRGTDDKSARKIKAGPIRALWSNVIDMSPIAIEDITSTLAKAIGKPSLFILHSHCGGD
jgi:hypothetical protein